ncbi:MAG: hypothetical protein WA991_16930 [Ornithinimicrobium sp.]
MPFPLPDPQGYCWAAFQEIVAADICENFPFFVIVALSAGWRSGGDVDAGRAGGGDLCEMAHAMVPREHS